MSSESVGFAAKLFTGQFDNEQLFPYPKMGEDEQEVVEMMGEAIGSWANDRVDSAGWDQEHHIPEEIIKELFDLGVMGMTIPESYGGGGLSMTAYAKLMEGIGAADASLAATIGAHQSIGMKALLLFGNEDQKNRYLPALANGERTACYALTEPGAGSDAGALKTRATWNAEEDLFYLSGSKLWITNGGFANLMTVFARDEVDGKDRITAFIVEGESDGITRGQPEIKMGMRASNTCEIHFENVAVTPANVLGSRGGGFKVAMGVLNYGRISLAAGCVGGSRLALKEAIRHANQRIQFGQPTSELEMVQSKIAAVEEDVWAMESLVYLVTALVDKGIHDFSIESAIAKAYCSERLWKDINHCVQIVGGVGYMQEYPFERWLRDSRINLIFEGTNEVQRLYIALAGVKRPADVLQGIAKTGGFRSLMEFGKHAFASRFLSDHLPDIHPVLAKQKSKIEEWTHQFSQEVEKAIRTHRKKIRFAGFVQERIANAAISLTVMLAVVSRTQSLLEEKGEEAVSHEVRMTKSIVAKGWRSVRRNLSQLDEAGDDHVRAIARFAIEREKE